MLPAPPAPPAAPEAAPRRVSVEQAATDLENGLLVAIPTETVYGLAGLATHPVAVRQIFAAKGRPVDHPLIVHLAEAADAEPFLDRGRWPDRGARFDALAAAFWPGPLTLVVPRGPAALDELTAGMDTVALRVPAHPLALALLRRLGQGLAAPSANRFGRVSPTTAAHVWAELGPEQRVLDGGPCAVGVESTILDLVEPGAPRLLRQGGLPIEALEERCGPIAAGARRASGTLAAHYAPRTALRLSADPEAEAEALRQQGLRVAVLRGDPDPAAYARRLYAELRAMDGLGVDILVAEAAPERGLGRAVNDRLQRAVTGSGRGHG